MPRRRARPRRSRGASFESDSWAEPSGARHSLARKRPALHAERGRRYSDAAMTYSIVARDPSTGMIGVAVQSHYFGVGRVVTWAEAGVGAIATQSLPEASYGPRGLELMRGGTAAPAALSQLVARDPQGALRQVAMIDSRGEVAVHTGAACLAKAGHALGAEVSVQANL